MKKILRSTTLRTFSFVLMAASAMAGFSPQAFAFRLYTVGSDANCSFSRLQDAISLATDVDGNSVLIAQNYDSTNQPPVVINGQSINLLGGLAECSSSDYIGRTTISGPAGHSVIEIIGDSHVYLSGLNITGGNLDDLHRGGGIFFGGQGDLTITTTDIYGNNAGYGAGISMSPSGGGTLTLLSGTLIFNNTASVSGGGIRLEGNTLLYALQSPTWIGDNHAPNGYGGGIEVLGPARADIGSSGFNNTGVVSENDAAYGGGLDVLDVGKGSPVVRFFAQSPTQPSAISNNLATINGGGIYLLNSAYACLFATHVDGNIAEDGAAIYADDTAGIGNTHYTKGVFINGGAPAAIGGDACGSPTVADLGGAESCVAGFPSCSTFSGNLTEHSDGSPSAGDVISMLWGDLTLHRVRLSNNSAAHIVYIIGNTLDIAYALFDDNSVSDAVIFDVIAQFSLARSTIAGNTIGGDAMIVQDTTDPSNDNLTNDILYQPGTFTLRFLEFQGTLFFGYILTNDAAGLPLDNPSIVTGKPTFVDAANGDYHLAQGSLGVDFAPSMSGADLDNYPSTVDLPYVVNTFGPSDLGAYEKQQTCGASDTFFCNGFESN